MTLTEYLKGKSTIIAILLTSVVIPSGTWVVNEVLDIQKQKGYMEGYEKSQSDLRDARYELVITRGELEVCRRSTDTCD